jgi:methionyl-tRNA formyltransferase
MLKTIILLTGNAHQQHALAALLREHNRALAFRGAVTRDELLAIAPEVLHNARLIAFTTGVVVPQAVLEELGHGAYNFHPGPPDYPGWAPAHFALYDGTTTFGATAHVMAARVDSGPIVGVEPFVIPGGVDLRGLEQLAFVRLARLFWRMARDIAREADPLPTLPVEWSGTRSTRRMYADMCDVPPDVDASELSRRIRAFHDDFRGIPLTVTLHGIRFQLATAGTRAVNQIQPKPQALRSEATVQHPLHAKAIGELAVVVAPGLDPERSCDHAAFGEVAE